MYLPKKGFPGKLSEFSIFLAWPAILNIYSHGLFNLVLQALKQKYALHRNMK